MGAGTCPRCGRMVALLEGRPFVTTDGVVELWHSQCFADRDVLVTCSTPADFLPTPPTPRMVRALGGGVAGSMLVAILIGQWSWSEAAPPPPVAVANVDPAGPLEPVRFHVVDTAYEQIPSRMTSVETELETRHPVPVRRGIRLDEAFPSLRTWTHPVTGSPEIVPERGGRQFGAHRDGIERPECGEGHCGVDLDGPRGRPIVAVAAGTVVRVELSELGLDGRSGRYVKIEHDDGTLTAYMHMDDVAALRVGDRVAAGQYVGTLGATAIMSSAPHLHFSLEVPLRPGTHGDHTDTQFVDPAPFLVRSVISSVITSVIADPPASPEPQYVRGHRHPIKPAL